MKQLPRLMAALPIWTCFTALPSVSMAQGDGLGVEEVVVLGSLRSAVSTGFKAPTIGQGNLRRSATRFDDGQLIETLVVPPASAVAAFYGGKQLQPEESTSFRCYLPA